MSRTAAAEAAGEADDPSAVADAYYDEATNLTLFKEDEVGGGYQCFENGSILVPLNEGGNQTVHSPEDVNEKFHKVCMCVLRQRTVQGIKRGRGRAATNCRRGDFSGFSLPLLEFSKKGVHVCN